MATRTIRRFWDGWGVSLATADGTSNAFSLHGRSGARRRSGSPAERTRLGHGAQTGGRRPEAVEPSIVA